MQVLRVGLYGWLIKSVLIFRAGTVSDISSRRHKESLIVQVTVRLNCSSIGWSFIELLWLVLLRKPIYLVHCWVLIGSHWLNLRGSNILLNRLMLLFSRDLSFLHILLFHQLVKVLSNWIELSSDFNLCKFSWKIFFTRTILNQIVLLFSVRLWFDHATVLLWKLLKTIIDEDLVKLTLIARLKEGFRLLSYLLLDRLFLCNSDWITVLQRIDFFFNLYFVVMVGIHNMDCSVTRLTLLLLLLLNFIITLILILLDSFCKLGHWSWQLQVIYRLCLFHCWQFWDKLSDRVCVNLACLMRILLRVCGELGPFKPVMV